MTVISTVSASATMLWDTLSTYASTHHDGIIALLLFTGVIIAFCGRVLLRPTVFLIGFVPASVAISALGLAVVQDTITQSNSSLLQFIVLGVAALAGILVGVVMLRLLFRVVTFLLCAGFGGVVVLVLHLFLFRPITDQNVLLFLYAVILFAALLSGLFSVSYPETGIILGTSFDGAAMSVFCLARFLGHRPVMLSAVEKGAPVSRIWAVAYGAAVVVLGVFGAITQRQVAIAELLNVNHTVSTSVVEDDQIPFYSQGDQEQLQLLGAVEPPRTPPYLRSTPNSPRTSGYGAIDQEDSQYSVVHNLGAAPLGSSLDQYQNGKEANGPLPL